MINILMHSQAGVLSCSSNPSPTERNPQFRYARLLCPPGCRRVNSRCTEIASKRERPLEPVISALVGSDIGLLIPHKVSMVIRSRCGWCSSHHRFHAQLWKRTNFLEQAECSNVTSNGQEIAISGNLWGMFGKTFICTLRANQWWRSAQILSIPILMKWPRFAKS